MKYSWRGRAANLIAAFMAEDEVSQWEARPQTETPKPRRQSSAVQPLPGLSYKTRFGIFFNAYSYFYVSHGGSMFPFIVELSSRVGSPRGKLYTRFQAVCGFAVTLSSV